MDSQQLFFLLALTADPVYQYELVVLLVRVVLLVLLPRIYQYELA